MATALSEIFSSEQPYEVKFILPKPSPTDEGKSDNIARDDPFGKDVLEQFLKNKPRKSKMADPEEYNYRMSEDGNSYCYYQAIRANNSMCFDSCHRSVGQIVSDTSLDSLRGLGKSTAAAEGDLMAVARLTFSTEPTRKSLNQNQAILIATAIITVFLAMVASYVIVRYVIVKPLRHLRDVSDAISRGNTTLRAEIKTGDEFEELAVAFNRMLRHLTDAQAELRQANVNLDGKVDELAQANMRLYELNMLKSDFLATMSHELRTPLNSILGFSDVLGSIDSLEEKQKRYVQNIQKSGKTLLEMINDILDLAKIESGKMETRLSDFQVANVISAQCDMARPLTERKNIDLETAIDPELPPLHQDQARVQQILNNLLSNAIKFTPEGGRITVSVRRDESNFMVLGGERHRRGHRGGGPAGDFREVSPGQDGHARRRRHDPRVFRQRPGALDRQGAMQAARRRGLRPQRVGQGEHVHGSSALGARRSAPARCGVDRRLRGVRQAAVRADAGTFADVAESRTMLSQRKKIAGS